MAAPRNRVTACKESVIMSKKGGFSCVMCKNISGRNAGIKFFRFPNDPEMSRLWLKACNRTINRTTEELYKNYRICSVHFNENMYLNDLKTRLLPRAIPIQTAIQTSNITNPNCDTDIISQGNILYFLLNYK
ncbi:52 kDa repressor of the inhibitor of the protein kinase-like [Temnothorax curvispinosus]|uniref:52 kDa repressor of the inhibitor of the protein kinase-like n=1 Tax=Temnothorax curvispinosus TaxID=300111 RepID=A0A6J1QBR6_9HYME|nr:52 kDa repressor of the inhibitor of the protein kinase-like [Temnothorax curvispinosus]